MNNETKHLSETLAFTVGLILQSDADSRHRIALAYQEAQQLVATIPPDNGDIYPRVVACFKRFDAYKAAEDIACAGWMLTAVQERVKERNLAGWRTLQIVIDKALKLLSLPDPTVH